MENTALIVDETISKASQSSQYSYDVIEALENVTLNNEQLLTSLLIKTLRIYITTRIFLLLKYFFKMDMCSMHKNSIKIVTP